MKKLFALAAVALTLCSLLTACGSKTETANDVDLTGLTVRRTGMPSILRPLTSGRLPRCCKTAPMWQ